MALRALNYKWIKIARLLGVSRSTLYNRLEEAGISADDHSQLTDLELDQIILHIKRDHPKDGEVLMQGHLLRQDIKVTRKRLRESIHRVDHEGTVARRIKTIKRRVYSVAYPNAVWHIDTHHKLIRWRLVTHAGVDGFSRTIVYIKCFDNNRAVTSLDVFCEGVAKFGLPEVVRTDHGGENIDIWRYMIAAKSGNVSCVITGSSTHNERVERLWRDVYSSVACLFAETFRSIEAEGYLDPLNEVDMFCLHFIFLPRINQCLQEFQESWNHHSLSTEGNKSPYQLFLEGSMYDSDNTCTTVVPRPALDDVDVSDLTGNGAREHVHTPPTTFLSCSVLSATLSTINVLLECSDHGKMLYINTIQQIGQHLIGGCNNCTGQN